MVPGRDTQSSQPGRPGKQELLSQPSRRIHKGTDTDVHVYSRNENKTHVAEPEWQSRATVAEQGRRGAWGLTEDNRTGWHNSHTRAFCVDSFHCCTSPSPR